MIGFRNVPCELASIGVAGSKCVEIYSEDSGTLARESSFSVSAKAVVVHR